MRQTIKQTKEPYISILQLLQAILILIGIATCIFVVYKEVFG